MHVVTSRRQRPGAPGWALILAAAVGTVTCRGGGADDRGPSPAQPTPGTIAPIASAHLTQVLDLAQRYSVNRNAVDWPSLRARAFETAGAAQTIPDTHAAIGLALGLLNDYESFYVSRSGNLVGTSPDGQCAAAAADVVRLPESVGYVKVERTGAGQSAEAIQQQIKAADRDGLAGWIVDLRGNGGGNMWPMIAGVGPVLGEGIIGWIVYNGREYEREYRDGAALSLGEAFALVQAPYTVQKPYPRVAVLTDGLVNSAGEALAVYFKGRPDTRSFGTPTCGHHHLLQDFSLNDGAVLWLTTARHEDRARRTYAGPIEPDEVITNPDEAVSRAVAWLHSRR